MNMYVVICEKLDEYELVSCEVLDKCFKDEVKARSYAKGCAEIKRDTIKKGGLAGYRLPWVKGVVPFIIDGSGEDGLGMFRVGTKNILKNGEHTYNNVEYVYHIKRLDLEG